MPYSDISPEKPRKAAALIQSPASAKPFWRAVRLHPAA
jgi:hypothetical protein